MTAKQPTREEDVLRLVELADEIDAVVEENGIPRLRSRALSPLYHERRLIWKRRLDRGMRPFELAGLSRVKKAQIRQGIEPHLLIEARRYFRDISLAN